MPKTIFLDTETTGWNPDKCGVFQIAGVIDIDGKTIDEFNIFSSLFDNDLIMSEAFEKNGSSLEKIGQMPPPFKAFLQFTKFLKKHVDQYDKKDKLIAVGYNADFDNRVLRRWFDQNGNKFFGSWFWNPWIDVMNLAIYILQDKRPEIENFKLSTVATFIGLTSKEEDLHNAMYDIKLTRDLYYELTK